jgi:hypothetical protein
MSVESEDMSEGSEDFCLEVVGTSLWISEDICLEVVRISA